MIRYAFGAPFQRRLGGSMMVAGTAIGAGMLGLPMISAGMWYGWSAALLFVSWFCMLRSSQALLEVNLHFERGHTMHTMVRETLGPRWNAFNGFSLAFVLYTLVYAYVSGGGSVVGHALAAALGAEPPRALTSLLFSLLLAGCVWWSSRAVDRFSVILMGGMIVTFLLSVGGMIDRARWGNLLGGGEAVFIFGAASTYLTSFCFHASVPSLIKYLGKDGRTIDACLRTGTLLALACYLVWITAADGIIARPAFRDIIAAGGNVGDLVAASGSAIGGIILTMLETFSLLAVATSFLGAGLGLFDYMADLCGFDDSRHGRTKTMLITFAPPMLCGIVWPDGFLPAIGWAGLASSVWSVIVPALLLRAVRREHAARGAYRAPGGAATVPLLLIYGVAVAVFHTLFVFGLLPMYR